MRDDTVVFVGFAEALAAPEVVWSLVDAKFDVVAFSRRGRRPAVRRSRHVTVHEITAPEEDSTAATRELLALLSSFSRSDAGRNVLLPLDDTSVWLAAQMPLPPGWILAGPKGDNARLALNKGQQIESARAAGFQVPESSLVSTDDELERYRPRLPIILRPINAVLERGTRLLKGSNWICSDEAELQRAARAWKGRGPLLAQPYLDGVGAGIFGLATEEGVVAWSAHRRLRMMNPHGSGSSACVSQLLPDDLKGPAERFVTSAGWRGLFMIELLQEQSGHTWFMEFNGRAWGSMALARRQGFEYPAWAVKAALNLPFPAGSTTLKNHSVTARNLGRELMHLAFVLRGPKSRAIKKWPSLWRSAWDVFRPHRRSFFYNWRRDDWRVFVADSWGTVRDQLRKPVRARND